MPPSQRGVAGAGHMQVQQAAPSVDDILESLKQMTRQQPLLPPTGSCQSHRMQAGQGQVDMIALVDGAYGGGADWVPQAQDLVAPIRVPLSQTSFSEQLGVNPAIPVEHFGEAARLELAVMMHPLYPCLLDAITAFRKVGRASTQEMDDLEAQNATAKAQAIGIREARLCCHGPAGIPAEVNDPALTEYLAGAIEAAEALYAELSALYADADAATRDMECQVTNLLTNADAYRGMSGRIPAANQVPGGGRGTTSSATTSSGGAGRRTTTTSSAGGTTSNASDSAAIAALTENATQIGNVLKRNYADHLVKLQEVFSQKRSKGKLPDDATLLLKRWWDAHLDWPYPSEDEKLLLVQKTGLDTTQVNNWLINMRKRHWNKMFPCQPQSRDEALQMLHDMGGLDAAMTAANVSRG